jgi:hypothetical protein
MRQRLLHCAALIAAVSLAGCAGMIHYDNAGVTNAGPEQGPMEYQHPAIGDFLCLAVPVGTPIYGNITSQPTGYTSDVVAFGVRPHVRLAVLFNR